MGARAITKAWYNRQQYIHRRVDESEQADNTNVDQGARCTASRGGFIDGRRAIRMQFLLIRQLPRAAMWGPGSCLKMECVCRLVVRTKCWYARKRAPEPPAGGTWWSSASKKHTVAGHNHTQASAVTVRSTPSPHRCRSWAAGRAILQGFRRPL